MKNDITKQPLGSRALFNFVGCAVSIAVVALLALATRSPFVFPSLGPTAFLFFSTPNSAAASPRNTIIGHAIGTVTGYLSLVVTGLTTAGPIILVGVSWQRVIAASLSLGITGGLMILLRVTHPPAGATTLIISLGILTTPFQLGILMLAVIILTILAIIIHRLAHISYPLWSAASDK